MKVRWMPRALKSLDGIFFYLKEKDAHKAAREIVTELWGTAMNIGKHPYIGKAELVLNAERETYRSLVVRKNYKIIYYCESQIIYIIDIWDVRQDPARTLHHFR